ncbi:MAG: hypothetical protein WC792_04365 [Candidatus Micrarchaeia archaeon]|jgi:uncharacterized membrane protein
MAANILTAMPQTLELAWSALALCATLLAPGWLALNIFCPQERQRLSPVEKIAASILVSILALALAGIALTFTFGLRNYSLALTLLALFTLGYLQLKKR